MALCITWKTVESEFGVTTFILAHVEANRSRFRLGLFKRRQQSVSLWFIRAAKYPDRDSENPAFVSSICGFHLKAGIRRAVI
jgi:hypothetical protein